MTTQKPPRSGCSPHRPAASSFSRASGSSQASSSGDIELPAYSSSQPPPPPPSYDIPGALFPNYRPEKQGPDVPAEPALIEERRAASAAPARPAPARVPARRVVAPVPAAVPPRQAQPAAAPEPANMNVMARRRFFIYYYMGSCNLILVMLFLMVWYTHRARDEAAADGG